MTLQEFRTKWHTDPQVLNAEQLKEYGLAVAKRISNFGYDSLAERGLDEIMFYNDTPNARLVLIKHIHGVNDGS
jgi:hypothetical protein